MPLNNLKSTPVIVQYFKYQVERFLIRGPFYQVLFIGFLIGVISIVAGKVLFWIEPASANIADNSWWAFLRMSDPGYLGDDNGLAKRVLATVLTLLGYVLFMGSLVAIMTQWLYRKMKDLEAGYTPLMTKGHIAILSYTNRTPIIVQQILESKNRLKRFLRSKRSSKSKIVILNPEVGHELITDLESHIGAGRDLQKVVFRTGDCMKNDDLGRINVEHSSVFIIPSMIYGGSSQIDSDTRVIKSLLSIKNRAELRGLNPPRSVVEILDDQNAEIAKSAYGSNLEVVSGRVLLSRMIAQNIQNPSLSYVIAELVSQGVGSEIYLRSYPELAGKTWSQVSTAFIDSIVIGMVSPTDSQRCLLNPKSDEVILSSDLFIFISEDFDKIKLDKKLIQVDTTLENTLIVNKGPKKKRKLLLLGWSNKVALLVKELFETTKYDFELDIVSILSIDQRKLILNTALSEEQRLKINHIEADYTASISMKQLDLSQYSNIVLISSDRVSDGADADARSILGLLQIRQLLGADSKVPVLIELAEPENEKLFLNRQGETIISPMVISYILGNVALRPELNKVFDSLFNAGGSDITFIESKDFELSEQCTFEKVRDTVNAYQMIAIGLMNITTNEISLNPKLERVFDFNEKLKVIVIKS